MGTPQITCPIVVLFASIKLVHGLGLDGCRDLRSAQLCLGLKGCCAQSGAARKYNGPGTINEMTDRNPTFRRPTIS